MVSSSFCFILFSFSFDVHLLLGQPLQRQDAFLEEVDLLPGDPRTGLKFSELLELERQRAQYITPAPSWKGPPWSSPNSAPGPLRTPSPSTDDNNSPSSTAPRRRGKSSSFFLSFFLLSDVDVFNQENPSNEKARSFFDKMTAATTYHSSIVWRNRLHRALHGIRPPTILLRQASSQSTEVSLLSSPFVFFLLLIVDLLRRATRPSPRYPSRRIGYSAR
jgi:hypothetical protein